MPVSPSINPDPPFSWAVGIPLLSSNIAKDWLRVTELLERTLNSLAAQRHPCSTVWIACHERPKLAVPEGMIVKFITVDFPPPRFTIELEVDKLRKLECVGVAHRQNGAGLLYLLDADDLIDASFSEHLLASRAKAFLLGRGYRLDAQSTKITELPKFWRRCGSCAVVNWTVEELPLDVTSIVGSVFRQFLDTRHFAWDQFFRDRRWDYKTLDSAVVMYVVNHGQNDSELLSQFSWKWRLYNRFWPGRPISRELARRFSLDFDTVRLSGRDVSGFNIGQLEQL